MRRKTMNSNLTGGQKCPNCNPPHPECRNCNPTDQECPNCGADTGGGTSAIDYNVEHPWQAMECDECGATWEVEYSVSSIDNLVVPKKSVGDLPIP
jgi:hypothetical protein